MEEDTKGGLPPGPAAGTGPGCGKGNPCEGCLHWYGAYLFARCCNYIFDMGNSRPCPPGRDCTVYTPYTPEDREKRRARELL